jgi:hypothetical protein
MASNSRQQLELWLKTLKIGGSVLDIGGLHMPIKTSEIRVGSWKVKNYKILDIKSTLKGYNADYVWDINNPIENSSVQYDNVFCIEVMSHIYDPMVVMWNMNKLCKLGGRLFVSTHFIFPNHIGGVDCLRYTEQGIRILLEKNGFRIKTILPKYASDKESLTKFLCAEYKVDRTHSIIGHLIEAEKYESL